MDRDHAIAIEIQGNTTVLRCLEGRSSLVWAGPNNDGAIVIHGRELLTSLGIALYFNSTVESQTLAICWVSACTGSMFRRRA
jgi:hypothetical protein